MALSQSQVPLTHLFAELSSLEDLRFPLERSSRLQYTCLSVSQRYIALGSNTGGVYIFSRESLKYLQVVFGDVEVSAVTATALSPNDQNVALADSSGQVIVMELNIERRIRPERVRQTTDHVGATVTAMLWDNSSSSLFVADSLGKVTLINVSASKAKTLFTVPSETIVRLDSSVYQMDWWSNKLLVSTVSRTYLLNNTRHQFSQIGQKSRDGKFGACFFIEPSSNYAVIYCARPGSRMWEVDFEGNVLNTHQFKQSLATHPSPIISQSVNLEEALLSPSSAPQSVNFQKMFRLGEFILTWSSHGVYVFDPVNVKVVLWMDAFKDGISDMCVVKNEVYIFLESQEVRRLVFLPIFLLCSALTSLTRCTLAARLLLYMENFSLRPSLLKRIKKELVPQLTSLLITEGHLALAEKISGMLEDVSVSSGDLDITQEERVNYPQYSTQLSGIVVVNDGSITSQEKGVVWRSVTPVNFTQERRTESEQQSENRKEILKWKTSDPDPSSDPPRTHILQKYNAVDDCTEDSVDSEVNNNLDQVVDKDLNGDDNSNQEKVGGNHVDDIDCDSLLTDSLEAPLNNSYKCDSLEERLSPMDLERDLQSEEDPFIKAAAWEEHSSNSQDNVFEDSKLGSDTEQVASHQDYQSDFKNKNGKESGEIDLEGETQRTNADVMTESYPTHVNISEGTEIDAAALEVHSGNSQDNVFEDSKLGSDTEQVVSHQDYQSDFKNKNGKESGEIDLEGETQGTDADVMTESYPPHVKISEETEIDAAALEEHSGNSQDNVFEDSKLGSETEYELSRQYYQSDFEKRNEREDGDIDWEGESQETDASGMTESYPPQVKISEGTVILERTHSLPSLHENEANITFAERDSEDQLHHNGFNAETETSQATTGEATAEKQRGNRMQVKKRKKVRANEVIISGSGPDGIQRSLSTGTLKQKKKKERQLEHGRSLESIEDIAQDHGLYIQTDKLNTSHINSIEEEDGKTDNEVPSIPSVQACRHSAQDTNVPLEANQISSIEDSLVKTPSVLDDETTSKSDSGFASPMDLQQQRLEVDEVIPPLIQRLSAMGVAPMAGALETDTMSAPETSVRGLLAGATRHGRNLLSVKDRVSSKISNTTKSLIKRVKEKNLLPSRSPSGSPPSGNYLNLPSPHAEVAGSVAHTSTVRHSGTAEDSDNFDPEAKVDLASFWSKTVQTQKELEKPNILLNAERLKLVLNSWAYELNKALLTYHTESYKKLEEKMKEGENLEETGKSSEKTYIDDQMTKKEIGETSGLIEITEEGIKTISTNKEASKESQEDTELVFATESEQKILDQSKLGGEAVDVIQIKSAEDGGPQSGMSASPKLVHVVRRNTDPSLVEVKTERNKWSVVRDSETGVLMKDWSEVCHTHDPFHFSQQKHMTVSALALHCLRAGCFGNILSVFSSQTAGPETIHSNPMSSFSSACTNSKPSFQFQDGDPLPFADQSLNLASDQNSCNHNFSGSNSTPSDPCVSKLSEGGSSGDKEVSQEGLAPDDGASQADSSALDMYKTDLNQDLANKDYNETSADAETSLVTNSADQQEHKDMERALFVQLHYHLLPHWRVRRLVTETEGDDVYHTWCSLITCYKSLGKGDIVWVKLSERDVTGALDYLRSGILPHKLAFLGHLASAFALSPLRVVEFATEVPRQVTLRDVLYLCRLLNKPRLQVVTRYLTLFLTPVVEHKRLEVVQQMCKMLEAKQVVLECLLSLHATHQSVTTTEGFFSGGADSSRLHPNDVEKMLSAVLSLVTDSELPYILDMCWTHRHWPGCLKLLTRSDQWKQALQLIIELNDLSLLDGTKDYGFMPRSIDEWRYLLQLYREKSYIRGQTSPVFSGHKVAGTKQEPPPFHSVQDERKVPERAARNVFQEECLSPIGSGTNLQNKMEEIAHSTDTLLSPVVDGAHAPATTRPQRSHSAPDFKVWSLLQDEKPQMSSSHQSISWTGLGLLAARHIGDLRAVELLEGCFGDQGDQDSTAGGLSEEFYAQCIAISGIQKRQKLVIHNMLEKVDSYLWAKKPVHIPPQVHYAVMQEKAAQESGKSGEGNYQDLFAKLSSVPLSNLPLAEDPDCHWGVVTNMNSLCQICQVNVTETVSHMEPGVLVFRCGHVFHKFCVPDQVCPLC